MSETTTSSPTPIVGIQPTTEAATSDWYDNRLPNGCFSLDFAAFSADGSPVSDSPFYFEKEVQGNPQRCADESYFRNMGRTSPGRWRVQKIPTDTDIGLQVDGYGVSVTTSD
jgi:hypothetical protein